MSTKRPGLQPGTYSNVPRTWPRSAQKAFAERKLADIKKRAKAGLPDEPLQCDPSEYERIMEVLVKEGKKSRIEIPGRPDLSAITQEDYWQAVLRGL